MFSRLLSGRTIKGRARGSPKEGRIRACIDQTTPAFIRGWAFDPTSKDPVAIELRSPAGELLMRGVANQPRPDVGRELGTDGMQGFLVPLPAQRPTVEPIDVFACSSSDY